MKRFLILLLLLPLAGCFGQRNAALAECKAKYEAPSQRPITAEDDIMQCMQDKDYILSSPHSDCSDDPPYSGGEYNNPDCYKKLHWWDNMIP